MCYKPYQRMYPCGQCLECRQARANVWALRCVKEAEKYIQNCFITLTYESSPVVLVKEHLQRFIKRLRKAVYPIKVKYFACGEYGDLHRRPHFHILIFGYDFPDKYEKERSPKGYVIYASEKLEQLWLADESGETGGLCTVQDLTLNSAAYCALYSSKPKSSLPKYLQDSPEFNLMSQGLGLDLLCVDYDKYYKTDEVWHDGRSYNIPQAVLDKKYNRKNRFRMAWCFREWMTVGKLEKYIKVGDHLEYWLLKVSRVEKAERNANAFMKHFESKGVYKDEIEALLQKKYKKENAYNRLTKKL